MHPTKNVMQQIDIIVNKGRVKFVELRAHLFAPVEALFLELDAVNRWPRPPHVKRVWIAHNHGRQGAEAGKGESNRRQQRCHVRAEFMDVPASKAMSAKVVCVLVVGTRVVGYTQTRPPLHPGAGVARPVPGTQFGYETGKLLSQPCRVPFRGTKSTISPASSAAKTHLVRAQK